MVNMSLREHLAGIAELETKNTLSLRGDFYVLPPSGLLRDLMRAMQSPKPDEWDKPYEKQFSNKDWTEECQGVTHDDSHWYLSSNREGKQRVYSFSMNFDDKRYVDVEGNGSDHLGDIDYYQGRIYCAMEGPIKILIIDAPPFSGYWQAELTEETMGVSPQVSCPWCAVNPWNGLLYSSNNGDDPPGENTLRAYRFDSPSGCFVHVPFADIVLQEKVRMIQGGVFSKNGHILLASNYSNDIRCYSVLNGYYLGRAPIQKDGSWNVKEEVEGLTIWEGVSFEGVATQVHVVLLDNDPNSDDVYFKNYRVPLAAQL